MADVDLEKCLRRSLDKFDDYINIEPGNLPEDLQILLNETSRDGELRWVVSDAAG
jgi:hypothetical protein